MCWLVGIGRCRPVQLVHLRSQLFDRLPEVGQWFEARKRRVHALGELLDDPQLVVRWLDGFGQEFGELRHGRLNTLGDSVHSFVDGQQVLVERMLKQLRSLRQSVSGDPGACRSGMRFVGDLGLRLSDGCKGGRGSGDRGVVPIRFVYGGA